MKITNSFQGPFIPLLYCRQVFFLNPVKMYTRLFFKRVQTFFVLSLKQARACTLLQLFTFYLKNNERRLVFWLFLWQRVWSGRFTRNNQEHHNDKKEKNECEVEEGAGLPESLSIIPHKASSRLLGINLRRRILPRRRPGAPPRSVYGPDCSSGSRCCKTRKHQTHQDVIK